jgi:hypothetical protein
MNTTDRQQVIVISQQLEELWAALDTLFAGMTASDWQQPHGPDWIFADLPYHLSYMDLDILACPIEMGKKLPEAERFSLDSFRAIDIWNDGKMNQRPAGHSVSDSLSLMEASRQKMRNLLANMTDADLMNPAWFALVGDRGYRPAMYHLIFCVEHTWEHYAEARLWRGVTESPLTTETLHATLNEAIFVLGLFYDPQKSAELDFSFGVDVPESGGGSWLFQPKNGQWEISEGALDDANLVLTCTVNGYIRMHCHMADFSDLIARGDVKVNNMAGLETLTQLEISEDYVFPINP